MNITVVGGGNIGTQFAVHFSSKGHRVIIYTSSYELFEDKLSIYDEEGDKILESPLYCATDNPQIAFGDSDLIVVTYPPMLIDQIADVIYSNTDSHPAIMMVPGNGGAECAFKRCIDRGNRFFGIERVPAVARLIKKGSSVRCTGYRNELHISAIPNSDEPGFCELIERVFEIKTIPVKCYLNLTLTPSNPILHTTRLMTMFSDYEHGKVYSKVPLFYEDWNDDASKLLFACDSEVQNICNRLKEFNLTGVKSLKDHYESYTVSEMTRKISSIRAFKGIKTPMTKVEGGYIPDLSSRYFVADFSYGLVVIKQVAEFADIDTPNIDSVLEWYKKIRRENKEFQFSKYGINSLDDMREFYLR